MQLWQYCLLVTAILLYMFRTLSASIIRSTKNCSSSQWYMTCMTCTSGCYYNFYYSWWWTQKASETCRVILKLLINNNAKVASFWFFVLYRLMMHGNSNINWQWIVGNDCYSRRWRSWKENFQKGLKWYKFWGWNRENKRVYKNLGNHIFKIILERKI